ncbi:hypothetical protein BDA96_10G026800 [Sorghum bicolor]|uniref:Uncharacterized protein n=2 Tax=Sorghum bicolor TaxID=4558 RepID=A0A921PZN7_SORBI|nr:hypothetical protein BDA96_10G026800 [Sorghum bicolor]OQU75752.1 hypothetical protein SORBI_3010G023132 [Sorghum bicolor]
MSASDPPGAVQVNTGAKKTEPHAWIVALTVPTYPAAVAVRRPTTGMFTVPAVTFRPSQLLYLLSYYA